MLETAKLIKNGIFYRLENDVRTDFIKNQMYHLVLPSDVISYIRTEKGVLIKNIIQREPRKTLCLFFNNSIRLPFLCSNFQAPAPSNFYTSSSFLENPNRCLVFSVIVMKDSIEILEDLGDIQNRLMDNKRAVEVYKDRINLENFTLYEKLESTKKSVDSFYTKKELVDLRHLNTFNIDPTQSKDFDDAISVDIENKIVYIHIVDITHLLNNLKNEHTKSAFYYGFTLYLPKFIKNILPDEYSEDLFSLIKGQDRYTITIEIHFGDNKNIEKYEIYRSLIHIKTRYDYETSMKAFEAGEPSLVYLSNLIGTEDLKYSKLSIPNKKLIINYDNGKLERLDFEYHNRMNKMIEAFMITSNRIITNHLSNVLLPQRYHPKSNITRDSNDLDLLSSLDLIKKYKIARYSSVKTGHFGLDLEFYTHFTSPIRRANDILVHNILAGTIYTEEDLEKMIDYLNEREKLNEKIEGFYYSCKLLTYIEENVDKKYTCKVLDVTKNGIRILINELLHLDFIHIANIDKNTRWSFDSGKLIDTTNPSRMICKNNEFEICIEEIDWFKLEVLKYKINIS